MAKEPFFSSTPPTLKSIIDRGYKLLFNNGGYEQMSTPDDTLRTSQSFITKQVVAPDGWWIVSYSMNPEEIAVAIITNGEESLKCALKDEGEYLMADITDVIMRWKGNVEKHLNEAVQVVASLVAMSCSTDDGKLDSKGITDYSVALTFLQQHGEVFIHSGNDRRVVASWRMQKDWHKT